ncbi:4-(cytidine 5'-diphospho)-2-C-methyl-D-erythritol kinase [Nocardioides halotolerans]|jgi:4-diphosphocytidyl-2-C-methyl-D-erythritol kinase|uniref:4-(cytidine 5'-diphospho)-2-C-methyl-D-erythritol kinase n=1 Tax=Nocardioides halotolerans TaxID=433660 RepID=UPI000412E811|nr:4-(cytidine 5'-diphospho)-2-C-methyl-D-erythritol kinase [Nocardioides halotolerans]
MTVTVRAPAKINLHLGVGAPRADGFHPLVTVYQAVGLCDDVTAESSPGWLLDVTVPDWMDADAVPVTGDNLVDRAARLLAGHHGIDALASVSVAKAIPVAGGMAGGSADAAAALVALDRLWQLHTSDDDLLALAARLGSDVPFALLGGTALGTGRGELVEPVPDQATWWWVAVPSGEGLSTPAVYRRFDDLTPDAPAEPEGAGAVLLALSTGDPEILAGALHNDLEAAALDLRPDLGDLLELGERCGALRGLVSGSGPTCVFLAESADAARGVAGRLAEHHEVVLVTNGPVAGAHVVTYG